MLGPRRPSRTGQPPAPRPSPARPRIQAALGGLLAAVVPRARIVPAVDPKDMNPDASRVQSYLSDPLNTGEVHPGWCVQVCSSVWRAQLACPSPAPHPRAPRAPPRCAQPSVGNLPVRTANEVLKGMRHLRRHWADFTLPLYVHHGAGDRCTSPDASQAFVAAASSADKVLHLVPGGFHEVGVGVGVGCGGGRAMC